MKTTIIQSEQELRILKEEYNQPVEQGDSQDQQNGGIIDIVSGPYIGIVGTNSIKILKVQTPFTD